MKKDITTYERPILGSTFLLRTLIESYKFNFSLSALETMGMLTNSEDPDETSRMWHLIRVCTVHLIKMIFKD